MGVLRCDRKMYYDVPTKSCTDCSVICENMDIQDTRGQCVKYCSDSDYFSTTTTLASSTTIPITEAITSEGVVAICVILGLLLLIVGLIVYLFRVQIVNIIKTQDCSGEEPRQYHAQETSLDSQGTKPDTQVTAAHALLPSGQEAFADLPQRFHDLSTLQYR